MFRFTKEQRQYLLRVARAVPIWNMHFPPIYL